MEILSNGMLSCGSTKGFLAICNPTNGLIMKILEGHDSCIESLYLLNDDILVSYSCNGEIKIWNTDTGELKKKITPTF